MSATRWPGGSGAVLQIGGLSRAAVLLQLERGLRAFQSWLRFRHEVWRTKEILSELPNAILRDIGIERSQIPEVARLAAEYPGIDLRSLLGR